MWMMGYNDSGEFNMPDSFNGRKLRPLMPRPMSSTDNNPASSPSSSPGLGGRLHGTDHIFALNHHLATMTDGKKEFNPQPAVVVSSRWNPTPEQLRTLEELYRRGTRTPTADQIQHITAQLRRYGKIEGKNVFYWFQNHKARERQKRRRQMESAPEEQYRGGGGGGDVEIFERKDSGASRTGYEGEETKNYWAPSNNCSALSEESASIQRTAKAGVADCRPDGWIQFDEGELLQHRKSFIERNATWQTMQQFPCPSPIHLINTITTTSTAAAATNIASIAAAAATAIGTRTATTQGATIRTMDPKLIKAPDFNIFVATHREIGNGLLHLNSSSVINEEDDDGCSGESPTLQLFPLHSSNGDGNEDFEDKEVEVSATSADLNANFTSCQFFEFLPLKN